MASKTVYTTDSCCSLKGSYHVENSAECFEFVPSYWGGLTLISRGKVRDSYELPGYPEYMLVVATNRVSVFDFVLNALIPGKGEVLNALSHFWTHTVLTDFRTDFIATGSAIDSFLPDALKGDIDLQSRATVVQRMAVSPDVEDIVRNILTGSAVKGYQKTGKVYEYELPSGLVDGSPFPTPLYTPTDKAKVGHDEPITVAGVRSRYPGRAELALKAAERISRAAESKGIKLADTKFEFALDKKGQLVLCDEKGTPDSSRFYDLKVWERCHSAGKPAPSLDKQFMRDLAKKEGISSVLDPENQGDLDKVHNWRVPQECIHVTTALYRYIFWRLTGFKLKDYQRERMGIDMPIRKRNVEVLIGSASDKAYLAEGVALLKGRVFGYSNVISCHRNPDALRTLVRGLADRDVDVIIACAGKAAALPGIVKSWLAYFGRHDIAVIGVGLPGNESNDELAAKLSVECLPGKPVELDPQGEAYFGSEGFVAACRSALNDEFLPRIMEPKLTEIGYDQF